MLAYLRQYLFFHWQAFISGLRMLMIKPLTSLLTLGSIILTLLVPLFLGTLVLKIHAFTAKDSKRPYFNIYLKDSSTKNYEILLHQIQKMPEIAAVHFISEQEGIQLLQTSLNTKDILKLLPKNPLPAVIEAYPVITMDKENEYSHLKQSLEKLPGVDKVNFNQMWVQSWQILKLFLTQLLIILSILFTLTIITIISSTMRLTILTCHEYITTLQLVGASKAYIIRPFLYMGGTLTVVSAFCALITINLLWESLLRVLAKVPILEYLYTNLKSFSLAQTAQFFLVVIIIGLTASFISVNKQLKSLTINY